MPFAQTSRHGLSYVAETGGYGTTPGTPTMLEFRHTSCSLAVTKEAFVSEEIRSDRQIEDLRHGTESVTGEVAIELSYGAHDDMLAAALMGSWATNVLTVGTTISSFTLERRFVDVAQYQVLTGCVPNTLSLSIAPNAMVTGTLGFIGKGSSISGTSLGTPTAAPSNPPFDGFSGAITEGGSAIASVTSLELNLTNNLSPAFIVGEETTPQLIYGRSNVTGTLTAFFESAALLNKFINETESALTVTLTDPAGNGLLVEIPRLKYTGGDVPATNADEALIVTLPFQALRHATDGNLKITRTPAEGTP